MFKRFCIALTIFPFAWASAEMVPVNTSDASVQRIMEEHLESIGGFERWSEIESLHLSGTVEQDGHEFDLFVVKKQPDFIRATVTIPGPNEDVPGIQVIRGFDGIDAWSATRTSGDPFYEKEKMHSQAAQGIISDAGVLPTILKYWYEGAKFSKGKDAVIGGTPALAIVAEPLSSGAEYHFYISPEDYLMMEYHVHFEGELTKITLSDYLEQDGVMMPFVSVVSSNDGRSTMIIDSVKAGVGIYNDYFRMVPDEKSALEAVEVSEIEVPTS